MSRRKLGTVYALEELLKNASFPEARGPVPAPVCEYFPSLELRKLKIWTGAWEECNKD